MVKYILHYAPAKIIPGLINFLGLMIYARIFTQEEYGRYAYVFATLGLIQSVLFPWIRMSTSRFYQKYNKENKEAEFENFTLFLYLLVSLALSIVWVLIFSLIEVEEGLKDLYILGLLVIISQTLFEQLMALARAKLQSKVFAYNMVIKAFIKISMVIILVVLFNLNEEALFIGIIVAHIIPIIIYFKKHFNFERSYLKISKHFVNETFNYGFPLTFSFVLVFIINSSDRILLEYFIDTEAVGLYSIPYDFSTFTLTNVFMVFSMAFFPILVKEIEHMGVEQMDSRIKQYGEVLLSFVFPCTIFMVMLAPFIAVLILGENYSSEKSILIIQLISIASFLAGLKSYFFDYAFQLGKNTYAQIIPVVIAAVLNIVLNIILIPKIGINGAIVATIVSFLVGIVFSIIIGNRVFRMKLSIRKTINILLINSILILLLYFIPLKEVNWLNFILNIIIGVVTYIILMIIFNVNDIRGLFLKIIKRFGA